MKLHAIRVMVGMVASIAVIGELDMAFPLGENSYVTGSPTIRAVFLGGWLACNS